MTPTDWTFEEALTMIPLLGTKYICTGRPHRGRELTATDLENCKRKRCDKIGAVVK